MTEKEVTEKILNTPKLDLPPTLDRIKHLLSRLGNPERRIPAVHVAGTNGKGSMSTMIASSLRAAGYRVGLFTSPYINDFKERFIVDGACIPSDVFTRLASAVFVAAGDESYTQFELITAIGLSAFCEMACDIVVLECGLGGRYDATNAIPAPLVSVIGQIGYDHTAILGDTIEKISAEKSKIIKPGSLGVVMAPQSYPEAYPVLECEAFASGVPVVRADVSAARILSSDVTRLTFEYKGESFTSSLAAKYQLNNAIAAIETLRLLAKDGSFAISDDDIRAGLASAYIPARLEQIFYRPTVILDGAHNIDGLTALRESLIGFGPYHLMIGMLRDKEPDVALRKLLDGNSDVLSATTVTPSTPRAMPAGELADILRALTTAPVYTADSISDGVRDILARVGDDEKIICCGSLYIMGDVRRAFMGELK